MGHPEEDGVVRHNLMWVAVVVVLVLGLPGIGAAQDARKIRFDVMVSRISQQPGEVDPRASRLDTKLRGDFRYESLKVLDEQRLSIELNELATLALPNGKKLELRPLSLSDRGVLVAVNVEGSVQSDLQVPSGHLIAIGAGRFEGGRLVISLEPHF
jgi:hypothetical protein